MLMKLRKFFGANGIGKGFTLIETLMAISMAVVVLLSVALAATFSLQWNTLERNRTLAQDIARNIMSQNVRTVKYERLLDMKDGTASNSFCTVSGSGTQCILYESLGLKEIRSHLISESIKNDLRKLDNCKCTMIIRALPDPKQLEVRINIQWHLTSTGAVDIKRTKALELTTVASKGDMNLKRAVAFAVPTVAVPPATPAPVPTPTPTPTPGSCTADGQSCSSPTQCCSGVCNHISGSTYQCGATTSSPTPSTSPSTSPSGSPSSSPSGSPSVSLTPTPTPTLSCPANNKPVGCACTASFRCTSNNCMGGYCAPPCTNNDSCPSNQSCNAGECMPCQSGCPVNQKLGLHCACVTAICPTDPCPVGMGLVCNSGVCAAPTPTPCPSCSPGWVCSASQCINTCTGNNRPANCPCSENRHCKTNNCSNGSCT